MEDKLYYLHVSYRAYHDKGIIEGDQMTSSNVDIVSLREDIRRSLELQYNQTIDNIVITSLNEVSKETFDLLANCK